MGTQLEKIEYTEAALRELLRPLVSGVPVVLSVNSAGTSYKKRVGDSPLLFITPSSVYGSSPGFIVLALQGFGCEVIDVREVRPLPLSLMGLPWRMAKILSSEITFLFKT